MSCGDLSQPSFAEALVSGYTNRVGILDDIAQAFDWARLRLCLRRSMVRRQGRPAILRRRCSRFCCSGGARFPTPPRKRRCATGCRSGAFAAFRWTKRYGEGGVNPRDPDARYTVKRGKSHFGYKAHLAVDEQSGLARQAEMTSANVHDARKAEAFIQGDEGGFLADKAYANQAFRETLRRRGIVDGPAHRAQPGHPLEIWQKWFNVWSSSVRSGVGRANATMKRWYGMRRVRYLGAAGNNCHLQFVAMTMNMKRALVLMREA